MKINRDSNVYTILYASIMVVIVAVLLAFTSESLRSAQKKNSDDDKRRQILRSVHVTASKSETEATYNALIKESFLVNDAGEKVEGDAFSVDAAKMFAKNTYPVFVATVEGQTKYVLAMYGTGLWGPVWGYISLNDDMNTVYGTDFSHQGETPGLGAEIATADFASQFSGKQVFRNGEFRSIAVVKSGKTAQQQDYVDGISGGTITSQGVDRMIHNSLNHYVGFLNANK